MVKVLDPDGVIIGVYASAHAVPDKVPNRMASYWYPRAACDIVEVTDPKDVERLLPSLRKAGEV